jgi:hypothetical protein
MAQSFSNLVTQGTRRLIQPVVNVIQGYKRPLMQTITVANTEAGELPELGKLVKEYKLSKARVKQLLLISGFSAMIAACFFLPVIFEQNSDATTKIGVSIVGLFCSTPMFAGIYQIFRLRGVSLSLYNNGFIFQRRGTVAMTTWDEIESYIQDSACRITKKNGEVIEFGHSIEGIEEVADVIMEQTLKRMLPQVKATIQSGSSVQFKGLKPFKNRLPGRPLNNFAVAFSGFSVDQYGITDLETGNFIAWLDVKDYGITQEKMGKYPVDVFFILDDKYRFRTRLGLLSNAHVLLVLCGEMTGLDNQETK